jgi:hypothetical protein
MKIRGLKDLEYYRLREGDTIIFHVKNKQGEFIDLKYEVHSNFLMNINDFLDVSPSDKYYNDEIFTILGLDSHEFCSKYYGYKYIGGIWPCYKDYDFEAATNVVKALYTVIDTVNMSESIRSWGPAINYAKEPISKHKAVRTIKEDNNSKLKRI